MRGLVALVVAALCTSACLVSSLQPIYVDDAIVFDEGLAGTWEIRESEITIAVTRGEWRSYRIALTDRFGTTRFSGHLTTIGASKFLNVRPEDGLERPAYVVATNGVLQIEIEPARVRVRELEYGTVLKRLAGGALGVEAGTDVKQNVLVMAPSSRVRAWLLSVLEDPAIFAEWKTLTRRTK